MSDFLIFYAPFIILIASIGAAFFFAANDKAIRHEQDQQD